MVKIKDIIIFYNQIKLNKTNARYYTVTAFEAYVLNNRPRH